MLAVHDIEAFDGQARRDERLPHGQGVQHFESSPSAYSQWADKDRRCIEQRAHVGDISDDADTWISRCQREQVCPRLATGNSDPSRALRGERRPDLGQEVRDRVAVGIAVQQAREEQPALLGSA